MHEYPRRWQHVMAFSPELANRHTQEQRYSYDTARSREGEKKYNKNHKLYGIITAAFTR